MHSLNLNGSRNNCYLICCVNGFLFAILTFFVIVALMVKRCRANTKWTLLIQQHDELN